MCSVYMHSVKAILSNNQFLLKTENKQVVYLLTKVSLKVIDCKLIF